MDVQKCELRGSDVMSGHARVGPPGFEPESEWARPDLNRSQWLPKPQGYQATPRAHREPPTDS